VTPLLLERELDLGKQWYREKSLEEAALQFRRVVQMARLTPSSDRLVEARALGNHATVLRDLHKLDEAILAYRFCCRILAALGERQLERRMLNGLSLCYMEAGRHADARVVCEQLLAATEREDNVELIRRRMQEIDQQLELEREEGGGGGGGGGVVVGTSFRHEEEEKEKENKEATE
jgi:tetratricopeptide (TPR) repeat protein